MTDKTFRFRIANLHRRTAKAILVDLCGVNDPTDDLGRREVWLPVSQVEIEGNVVTLPAWLARAKSLNWQ